MNAYFKAAIVMTILLIIFIVLSMFNKPDNGIPQKFSVDIKMMLSPVPVYTNNADAMLRALSPYESNALTELLKMNESVVIHEYDNTSSTNLQVMFDVSGTPSNQMPKVSFSTNEE